MDFIEPARRIGADLITSARELEDGSITWDRGVDRNRGPAVDSGLFNGRCAEGLLFASLHAATGDPVFAPAARQAFLGLLNGLPNPGYRSRLAAQVAFGLSGLGGILYALVRAADFLGSSELLASAGRLAEAFAPEITAADRRFDIVWGSAGALLGLLALAGTGCEDALRRAEACAVHLLANRSVDPESGLRAWNTLRAVPSSGFAHGACGIAHALLHLHRRTGAAELYDAAMEAFAFERTLYRDDLLNWRNSPDEKDSQPILWGWCHGAPGIGLSRLAALDCLRANDEPVVARDLHRAITATLARQIPGVDTICCGYFGRIDFLIEAGRCLGNPTLAKQAAHLAGERLARAAKLGFALTPEESTPLPLQPGFWQSLGGTAYTLLRLTDSRRFPCVLAMT